MFRVLLAMAATLLRPVTGNVPREAGASPGIGLLLVYVAFRLGRDARDQLTGASAHPRVRRGIGEFLSARAQIDNVASLLTMRLDPGLVPGGGPGRSRPRNRQRGGRAGVCVRIRTATVRTWPTADHVFLDIANAPPRGRVRVRHRMLREWRREIRLVMAGGTGKSCRTREGAEPTKAVGP